MPSVLEGIKVADFSWIGVGPMIAKYLADHGATVVHVESITSPDVLRLAPPYKDGITGIDRSGYFATYNNNKYGLSLNLNHPAGREVARRLVAWSDIVVESFTPGTMKRWGLDYEELRKARPDIIMISTCNQGQSGPHATHPGFGTQLVSLAGVTHITGWPDRPPAQPYAAYTDIVAPRFGLAGLITALDYRDRTGMGQYLDLSQQEAAINLLAPLALDYTVNGREAQRMGNRCPYAAPHGAYPCRGEDEWCVIAVFSDEEWQSFCHIIGDPEWSHDPRFASVAGRVENSAELDQSVEAWTRRHTAEEVMTLLQEGGVAAGIVHTAEGVHSDPQLAAREHFGKLEHREIGRYHCDGPAFKLSKTPAQMNMPAPCLGEHNEYVLKEILGLSEEEFVELLLGGALE